MPLAVTTPPACSHCHEIGSLFAQYLLARHYGTADQGQLAHTIYIATGHITPEFSEYLRNWKPEELSK